MISVARPRPGSVAVVALVVFAAAFTLRIWGVTAWMWFLYDQMRDWDIAQRSFLDLPLLGPATHFRGYTIGPAFYWIVWLMRLTIGPFFDNLPHAGGIGHAAVGSAADALLVVAVWRRTGQLWGALAAAVLLVTGGLDFTLSATIWNPMMGSILAKTATALVLLDWHRDSTARRVTLVAIAWAAVHSYTGAVYVTVSVFAALVLDPVVRRDWSGAKRNLAVIGGVVAALQIPWLIHQIATKFNEPAMGAVTGGLGEIIAGRATPEVAKSVNGYLGAVRFIQISPWTFQPIGWVLLGAAAIVALRYRKDLSLLVMLLLPPVLAVIGYALFLGGLDNYYYFSLMPSAVLLVVLAATAIPQPRIAAGMGILLLIVALAAAPSRVQYGNTLHRMPEYGPLVEGSRTIARRGIAMRDIRIEFTLPPTGDRTYIYRLLGGRFDPKSPWVAVIARNGSVTYEDRGGQ